MKLEIKDVRQCRNKAYGNFLIRGHEKALITVSLKKNRALSEYAATLLHEMLHAYTTLLRVKGFKITDRNEHKYIERCETEIIKVMVQTLPRRK